MGISLSSNAVINSVDPNSPAEKAGLKKDHKIVEVNGLNVRDKSYKEIATLIKENEQNLVIGVVSNVILPRESVKVELIEKPVEPTVEKTTVVETIVEATIIDAVQTESKPLASASSQKISGNFFGGDIFFKGELSLKFYYYYYLLFKFK